MALKKSEKLLVGGGLIVGGIALFIGLGLPQWDAYSNSNSQVTDLNQQITDLGVQKDTLNAQIALLEKNTDIPPGIEIKTYTPDTKEATIKELLDQVVGMATQAGNKFISLTPTEAEPILPPAPASKDGKAKEGDAAKTTEAGAAAAADANGEKKEPVLPAPILSTFGYDLAIRGTYNSIQNFLKLMDDQKALLEISAIRLENEAASDPAAGGGDKVTDPSAPIRLTAKLRLALQPIE